MDLSKLPRLSQTSPPPGDAGASGSAPAKGDGSAGAPPAAAAGPTSQRGEEGPTLYCRCGAPLPPGSNFCSHCGAGYREATGDPHAAPAGGFWIEAFLSIGVAIFLLLVQPNGAKYWFAKVSGSEFAPFVHPEDATKRCDFIRFQDLRTGAITEKKYADMPNYFWSDTAILAFALALMIEGIVLAVASNRWTILGAGLLIAASALLNLWYVFTTYGTYGIAPVSLLAVIFGIAMAAYQFRIFAELSPRRR